ncbi:MAG: hypothetical protein JOZ22_22595 [Acidobacteriia bacterium]|nr:hypothetical protein [Terriglobia bacterium]MBV9744795.1 hypothetical protein [Terriglobia bacterium]
MDWSWLDWAAVAVLGGVVGASELISRYKDHPGNAIRTWPAGVYIAINAIASAGALGLIRANGWFVSSRWTQILMAGVSAMAFFRTSLFVVRAGDRDVGVGPSGFLQIFLGAADRAVDRRRARARSEAVARAMKDVDYDKAKGFLPEYCLALMQNVAVEDQQSLVRALKDVEGQQAEPSAKALLLGLELINVVGVDVLETAVKSLGDQIRSIPGA